jgi:hypothetical protein
MANHPNRSTNLYFVVSPRGFDNEVIYLRVPADKEAEVDAHFAEYENDYPGSYAHWTEDRQARIPGVAINWSDRHLVSFGPGY